MQYTEIFTAAKYYYFQLKYCDFVVIFVLKHKACGSVIPTSILFTVVATDPVTCETNGTGSQLTTVNKTRNITSTHNLCFRAEI